MGGAGKGSEFVVESECLTGPGSRKKTHEAEKGSQPRDKVSNYVSYRDKNWVQYISVGESSGPRAVICRKKFRSINVGDRSQSQNRGTPLAVIGSLSFLEASR
jgi:hypothetical protein